MDIFLSWSGERSKQVASFLKDWLCCVVQSCKPWVSNQNIDPGSPWFGEINEQLRLSSIGIVCLTEENKNAPWILFEAGALAKGLTTSRVCPILIDLDTTQVDGPLAQFNHTVPDKTGMRRLINLINTNSGNPFMEQNVLDEVFETYWPKFETRFKDILSDTKLAKPVSPRSDKDILGEILEITRGLNARVKRIETEIKATPQENLNGGLSIGSSAPSFYPSVSSGLLGDSVTVSAASQTFDQHLAKALSGNKKF